MYCMAIAPYGYLGHKIYMYHTLNMKNCEEHHMLWIYTDYINYYQKMLQ